MVWLHGYDRLSRDIVSHSVPIPGSIGLLLYCRCLVYAVGELSVKMLLSTNQWEDRWFRWLLVASITLHSMVFVVVRQLPTGTATQATHQAISVSLNLLQAEEKRSIQSKPVTKQLPKKTISPPRPVAKKTQRLPAPTELVPATQPHPLTVVPATAPQQAESVVRGTADSTKAEKETYLAKLLKHIEGHKFYPRLAQQRGIEGTVRITFRLLANGEIDQLTVSGGHLLLQQAARAAIQQAVPMLVAPANLRLPFSVSFMMQFRLAKT